jgi:hypothetical protein
VTSVSDGNLPAALDRLYIAVAALIDPLKEMHDGVIVSAPSLYEQLHGELAATATRSNGEGRIARRSLPPVWTDALDLQIEIDDATRAWQGDMATTPARLRALAARAWRPQDAAAVKQIACHVESWTVSVKSLLSPAGVKHVSAACPACGATSVFRRDSAGELVRAPALQIVTEIGCTCQKCRYTWSPEYYLHLAQVLGLDAPAGVIG